MRLLPARFWLEVRTRAQLVRRMDYQRGPIYLKVDSQIENDVRLHEAGKEPGTVRWIERDFKPGDVFFDIGANVGSFSLIAFRFLGGKARIYAFEPGFTTFPQLCHNTHLNRAGECITPLQIALSDRTTLSLFHYRSLQAGGALHAMRTPKDWTGARFEPVSTLPVISYRLDDFVRQFDLPEPSHVKIDVDGLEYQILRGTGDLLKSPSLRSLLIELPEDYVCAAETSELLATSGFALQSRMGANCLYVRRQG